MLSLSYSVGCYCSLLLLTSIIQPVIPFVTPSSVSSSKEALQKYDLVLVRT